MRIKGLGQDQRNWLGRIHSAGGEVEVHVTVEPVAWIRMEGSPDIRVPIRVLESLLERNLFEKVDETAEALSVSWAKYRLKDLTSAEDG